MKSKTFSKKLILNKKTIADLSIGKMKNAYGGMSGLPTCLIDIHSEICCTTPTCISGGPLRCFCGIEL